MIIRNPNVVLDLEGAREFSKQQSSSRVRGGGGSQEAEKMAHKYEAVGIDVYSAVQGEKRERSVVLPLLPDNGDIRVTMLLLL